MAVPSSGPLQLYGDIGTELGVAQSNVSLHGMSQTAGFTPPDAMSEFYGYSPIPPVATSFNTVLYTGNNNTNQITGVGFQPDIVWVKNRFGYGHNHVLSDTLRGVEKYVLPNLTLAEVSSTGFASFDSDGFTFNSASTNAINEINFDYVAWCWKAGGAAVTNTNGSVSAQVSANVEAGFSIVKYTATGGGTYSVGHGLSQTPDFVIVKPTTENVGWTIWSSTFPNLTNSYINFTTMAVNTAGTVWGSGMTSTVIGQTSGATSNPNQSLIAYAFHSVAGFSKFGSFSNIGSGTLDFGFEPAFVLIKTTAITDNWRVYDNKRDTVGINNAELYPNLRNAEYTGTNFATFTSTGLDFSGGNTFFQTNDFIYMAFANQF